MAKRLPESAHVDDVVEGMLRDGALVSVPRDFHGRVMERVRLAALERRERVRFRNALLTGAFACFGVVALAGSLLAYTSFDLLLNHGVSGGLGFVDYHVATFQIAWPGRADGLFMALFLGLGGLTIWAGLWPLFGHGLSQAATGRAGLNARQLRTR